LRDHKFKSGESVLYASGIYGRGAASSVYKITQLLPSERYRIKSSDEPHERVVKESELKRDSRPPAAAHSFRPARESR